MSQVRACFPCAVLCNWFSQCQVWPKEKWVGIAEIHPSTSDLIWSHYAAGYERERDEPAIYEDRQYPSTMVQSIIVQYISIYFNQYNSIWGVNFCSLFVEPQFFAVNKRNATRGGLAVACSIGRSARWSPGTDRENCRLELRCGGAEPGVNPKCKRNRHEKKDKNL